MFFLKTVFYVFSCLLKLSNKQKQLKIQNTSKLPKNYVNRKLKVIKYKNNNNSKVM